MYNIFRESILTPKELIKYHTKKGWFVFLYMLILALLLSIDMFVLLIADNNVPFDNGVTACQVVDGAFVCTETPIEEQNYAIYGTSFYFLSDNQEVRDVLVEDFEIAVIVKDDFMYYRVGETTMTATDASGFTSVSDLYSTMKASLAMYMVIIAILQNLLVLTFIILISTLPFLRFRKEIRYGKIFKLVTFAATPIALLLLITNLLGLSDIFFFIVMFIGYRSVFALQKELYSRQMMRRQKSTYTHQPDESDVIDQENDDE